MKLKADSWLVRWAYFFSKAKPDAYGFFGPTSTTLCAFFWRAFVFVPLAWLLIATAIGGVSYVVYTDTKEVLIFLGAIIGLFTLMVLIIGAGELWERRGNFALTEGSTTYVFVEGVRSIKSRFCPIIQFSTE